MGGAALSQVHLDRVGVPAAIGSHHYEVECEAPDNALLGEDQPNPARLLADQTCVAGVGREATALVLLAGLPSEQLIVRREELDHPGRSDAHLNAGAAEVAADDALLHDASVLLELGEEGSGVDGLTVERHARDSLLEHRLLRGCPRRGEAAQVDERVSLPADAVVELEQRLFDLGSSSSHPLQRPHSAGAACDVFLPQRMPHTSSGEEPAPPALGAEVTMARIGSVHGNPQHERQIALERRRDVWDQMAALRPHDQSADAGEQTRAVEQLGGQRPPRAVPDRDEE